MHTPLEGKTEDRKRNAREIAAFDYGDGAEYIHEGEGRRKMRQDDPDYAAMVENVDENVGRLLAYLEEQGLAENTIVVLTSDHGGLSNDGNARERHLATTNLPLRAGKGWFYEGGIRVPLILRRPGSLPARTDSTSIVMGMDVLPTLLDLITGEQVKGIDGRSFVPVIDGDESWDDRTVYWHKRKARPHSTGDTNSSVIRSGDYKLLHWYESDRTELYNIVQDPGEHDDLSRQLPEKTAELLAELREWKEEYLVDEKMKLKVNR